MPLFPPTSECTFLRLQTTDGDRRKEEMRCNRDGEVRATRRMAVDELGGARLTLELTSEGTPWWWAMCALGTCVGCGEGQVKRTRATRDGHNGAVVGTRVGR